MKSGSVLAVSLLGEQREEKQREDQRTFQSRASFTTTHPGERRTGQIRAIT